MVKMSEAEFEKKFGENRAVAALAVLVEDEITGKKRVIHDGTHGVKVNQRIRCKDKVRMPGPRVGAKEVVLSFAKAHRRLKYQQKDQGFLA